MAGNSGKARWLAAGMTALTLSTGGVSSAWADTSLLNVSYDVTRELYAQIKAAADASSPSKQQH